MTPGDSAGPPVAPTTGAQPTQFALRRGWLGLAVAALAAGTGAGWAWWRPRAGAAPGPTLVKLAGDDAPPVDLWSLVFEQPDGGELRMASLRGQPLLINFWATWCPPCVKEMPLLDSFQRAQAGRGWRVLGLAVDGPTPVRNYLARRPVGFAIGLAGLDGVALSRSLGNDGGQLPYTVVFDAAGRLRHRKLGTVDEFELAAWVRELA